jgi:hypothetical protein
MTMQLSFGSLHNPEISQSVLMPKFNIETREERATALALKEEAEVKLVSNQVKAEAIDAYFKARSMPLSGMGMKMVEEAEKNDLDWRLLPAIAIRESTGGKHDCIKVSFNAFGWGSCRIGFKSNEHAIETVARNLGGNNPKTVHHYGEKTTIQILRAYNPPSIVLRYAEQVISIMDDISLEDTSVKAEV